MKHLQKLSWTLFFVIASASVFAQAGPPPMAMPADSNSVLVDKIIEITKHEQYFKTYCAERVIAFAKNNNWSAKKTEEILGSIDFNYYNSTIYNSYAFYSTAQLKTLLEALTLLADRKNSEPFILTNSMMQSNLDRFVEGVIKGKYVTR